MPELMSPRIQAAIDQALYPKASCAECDSTDGHQEEVWTGNTQGDNYSGYELWFCCHECRDKGLPCETFRPIRVKPGTFI